MDTKDTRAKMIIYEENEIENWSPYQVAKSSGEALLTIKITKTNDEKTTVNIGLPALHPCFQ